MDDWDPFRMDLEGRPRVESVTVAGTQLRAGDRVRLWPLGRADIMDIALEGKTATIAAIEQDYEDRIHLAVTVDDDPGKDFGVEGKPGHRFFFGIDEVEPLGDASTTH